MLEQKPLGPLLGYCAHLARERMDARLAPYSVTPSQTHVLMYLGQHDGQAPQYDLTRFLRVKPSTANGILDRMCEKDLVERSVSHTDARCRLVHLTDKGREQLRCIEQQVRQAETVLVRGFTPEEEETLRRLVERVARNMEEDREIC